MAIAITAEITVKVNGDALMETIRQRTERGLLAMANLARTRVVAALSRPNTGQRVVRTRATSRGPAGSSYTVYPHPSQPGEPPKARTGLGRRSLMVKKKSWKEVRLGWQSIAFYMAMHEVGIRYRRAGFQQRPSLRPTVKQNEASLRAVFAAYGGA